MRQKSTRKVAFGTPMFPERSPLSAEEKVKRQQEAESFNRRCEQIFRRVYPELVPRHYNWSIHIEPNSGDYFIDPDEEASFQKAKDKYPHAILMAMRLNNTGCVDKMH
jgi:hypothetical protein